MMMAQANAALMDYAFRRRTILKIQYYDRANVKEKIKRDKKDVLLTPPRPNKSPTDHLYR